MKRERITVESAWQLTLLSRNQWRGDADYQKVALPDQPECAVRLTRGGEWTCDLPVDSAAAALLDMFLPLCAPPRKRLVVAQMGQSLDGRIATAGGISHYINGPDGITHLHRLRALVDAVVIGAGTASADNPQLTVRHVSGPNPVRVILDPNRRVPSGHQVFKDRAAPTLRLVADSRDLSGPTVTDISLDGCEAGHKREVYILDLLADRGLHRVLVEGGGLTVSRFLEAGLIDRLHLLVAPMIIGSGRPAFTLPPMETLEGALRPRTRVFSLGTDTLFDLQPGSPAG